MAFIKAGGAAVAPASQHPLTPSGFEDGVSFAVKSKKGRSSACFFSCRRRHTTFSRDWSSDVCSSDLGHGSVLIAAITSCTNTSNPSVMLAAGLLAKKAVERGLTIDPAVKTSLAPGSRVVSDYLNKTGLQPYLNQL